MVWSRLTPQLPEAASGTFRLRTVLPAAGVTLLAVALRYGWPGQAFRFLTTPSPRRLLRGRRQ